MKKILFILIAILLLATPVSAMSNTQLINKYCKTNYPGKQIRIVQQGKLTYKQFTNRKGKRVIYVIKRNMQRIRSLDSRLKVFFMMMGMFM